ncbi:MAG: HTH-type transcriptional regulator BhcR [Pseudomonadota bacterium]
MDEIVKRPRGRPRKQSAEKEGAPVQALERGLHLLNLLARERRTSLTEIALRAGMPPSTAHRLLTTLQNHRFADFDENTQGWMIGVEAFRIGSGFLNRINIVEAAQPVMHALVTETGETANLAIADAGDVVFVSQVETPNPIRAFFRPGTRSHMHASGAGKALLAQMTRPDVEALLQQRGLPEFTETTITKPDLLFDELDQIGKRGWSYDDEERYAGMRCIAAPVFGAHGTAVAAVSVSGPSARFTEPRIADFSAAVRQAAHKLSQEIGGADR